LRVPGAIIGGFPEACYTTGKHTLAPGSRLYVYSDGVYELARTDETTVPLEEFATELGKPATTSKLDDVMAWATGIRAGAGFEDDLSILELLVP
jgi:sigma-B regulation protein RsbU (phosphoserine phosphatase)